MKELGLGRRSNHGSFIVDGRGTILGFDDAMESLTDWPAIDVVGQHKDLRLLDPEGRATGQTVPLYDGRIPVGEDASPLRITLNCRHGRRLDVDCSARPLAGGGQRTMVTVHRVLARSAGLSLSGEVTTDEITGLADLRTFRRRLREDFLSATATARPLALILLDVDHLREINDRHGHEAGDDLLRKLAGILRATVDDDRRVARLGADDFAILLPNGGRGDARQLAATLRSTVERFSFFPTLEEGESPRVTISLGAASFPADADNDEELFQRAGEALDEARAMGRNRVWCYLRRPRVPLQVPVFFDGSEPLLVGYTRDLSPSGIFVQTSESIEVGMRCALAFPLPGHDGKVHVVGRVVRTVLPDFEPEEMVRIPGLGIEFERFGGRSDRSAIEQFLHGRESSSLRPENGMLSHR